MSRFTGRSLVTSALALMGGATLRHPESLSSPRRDDDEDGQEAATASAANANADLRDEQDGNKVVPAATLARTAPEAAEGGEGGEQGQEQDTANTASAAAAAAASDTRQASALEVQQGQPQIAVDKAVAEANARWATVLKHENAEGRTAQAVKLLEKPGLSAEDIIDILGDTPAQAGNAGMQKRLNASMPTTPVAPNAETDAKSETKGFWKKAHGAVKGDQTTLPRG